jgi:hypothetical protein
VLPRALALALCLAVAAGCANHVRFDDEVRERETRDVIRATTRIQTREPVIAQAAVELALSADERVRVRRRETLVRLDEETPWRAQNELWEVPAGLVTVPVFLALRAADKLCLGLIPDDTIENGTDFSFAALNPALNVESTERLHAREVTRKSRELERAEEEQTRPLTDTPVVLSLGRGPSQRLSTDGEGHVRIELLALVNDVPATPPRMLRIEVAGEGARKTMVRELPLTRLISARVARAAKARATARAPGVSAEAAAQALVSLDALGFPESALALEHELRDRQHANSAWLSRLDLALADE